MIYYFFLFIAKVVDNALGTAKTILVQKNKAILAGMCLAISNFIYFYLTKDIVLADNNIGLYIIAIASGVGCYITMLISNKFSKDRIYINVIMSDNLDAMKNLRDFLAEHHITNVASDSYTLDWGTKTLTITAYAETKDESRIIDEYISNSKIKYKRVINGV